MALFTVLYWVVPLAFVAALVLGGIAIGQRREPDPTGRRPYLVYLLAILFVALVTIVAAGTAALGSLGELVFEGARTPYIAGFGGTEIGMERGFEEIPGADEDSDKKTTSDALQAGLVLLAGLLLYRFHASRLDEVVGPDAAEGVLARTHHVYLYLVCFTAAVVLVVAGAAGIYGLLQVVIPGSLSGAPEDVARDQGAVQLLRAGVLTGASAYLFRAHWMRSERARRSLPAQQGP